MRIIKLPLHMIQTVFASNLGGSMWLQRWGLALYWLVKLWVCITGQVAHDPLHLFHCFVVGKQVKKSCWKSLLLHVFMNYASVYSSESILIKSSKRCNVSSVEPLRDAAAGDVGYSARHCFFNTKHWRRTYYAIKIGGRSSHSRRKRWRCKAPFRSMKQKSLATQASRNPELYLQWSARLSDDSLSHKRWEIISMLYCLYILP